MQQYGANCLPTAAVKPWWRRLLMQFKSALAYLLLAALLVDLLTWFGAGMPHFPVEAVGVAAVLLRNAGLGRRVPPDRGVIARRSRAG